MIETGSNSRTLVYEPTDDGDYIKVWPCHCGTTHRGFWRHEEWIEHNCDHWPADQVWDDYSVICMMCGRSAPIETSDFQR